MVDVPVVGYEKVGEDDYHQLKHDQCLRVDFNSFPRKFIELLESCRGNAPGATALGPVELRSGEPSFLARLETAVTGGFSVFSLVETNPFKELTHLSLKFRAGNDAAIKTYLAARLRQVTKMVVQFRGCWVIFFVFTGVFKSVMHGSTLTLVRTLDKRFLVKKCSAYSTESFVCCSRHKSRYCTQYNF